MAAQCQICERKEGTAKIVVDDGTVAKQEYEFWTCYVCRLSIDISSRTGVPSIASQQLAKKMGQAKRLILPIRR